MTERQHPVLTDIAKEAEALQPWISERRQHLHRHPELSFQEEKTAAFVREQVRQLGLEPSEPIADGKHGFFVDVRKSGPGSDRFVLLRADMDALPIVEENEVDFRSQRSGVGHLCGHDAHTSMLLGALKLLASRRESLPVSVRFVFQHAEEVAPGGAIDFVRAGAVSEAIGCFGIHVSPRVESGRFGMRSGEFMAMVGGLEVTMRGRGGHAAAPHESVDPVVCAAQAISSIQQIVSRRISPVEPAVVSITMLRAGTAYNVIPEEAFFAGTIRTFNTSRAPQIEQWIREIVNHTAAAYGCEASIRIEYSYPPVINDGRAVEAADAAVRGLFGERAVVEVERSMGAEDFAYFAQEKPSAFVNLGVRPAGAPFYPLHHPRFLPDESTLWRGSAMLAAMPFVAPDYL